MKTEAVADIGQTLRELARPGLSPKQLFDATKARHPSTPTV